MRYIMKFNESIEVDSLIDLFQDLETDFDTVDVNVEKLEMDLYTIKISFSDEKIPNNFGTRLIGYINRAEETSHTTFVHLTLFGDSRHNYMGGKEYLSRKLDNDYKNNLIKYIKIFILHDKN